MDAFCGFMRRMKASVLALSTSIKRQRDGRTVALKTCEYSHSGRNKKVRRVAENHGREFECGNVAYRIFHLNKVSF